MRVRVYPDGDDLAAREYELTPPAAVARFCIDADLEEASDIVVEPTDDEAAAWPGWREDVDGPFRIFCVAPVVQWDVRETTFKAVPEGRSP